MWMGITWHDLAQTTKRLVGANCRQVKLYDVIFLNLTMGNAMSSKQVYVTSPVTCVFLSQKARKELCALYPNFPAQASETSKNQLTTVASNNDNQRGCPNKPD